MDLWLLSQILKYVWMYSYIKKKVYEESLSIKGELMFGEK